jgi:hypothetical protein
MYATPANNYWLVGDQDPATRWSSARVIYVPDSDATYVQWLADGYETSEIESEQQLADLLNETYPAGSPIPLPAQPVPGGPVSIGLIRDPAAVLLARMAEEPVIGALPKVLEGLGSVLADVKDITLINQPTPFAAYVGQYTVPAGVYKLLLFGQASGGGGGGTGTAAGIVGGGGGPGETRLAVVSVHPGDIIDYTIGTVGLGGATGANAGQPAGDLLIGGTPAPAPFVKASNASASGALVNNYVVTLPAGIVAGDLIVLCCRWTTGSVVLPTGYTQVAAAGFSGAFTGGVVCYYKNAVGGETTVTMNTTGGASGWTVLAYVISGHDPAYNPLGLGAVGSSRYANPPSLNASALTAVQKLWLAMGGGAHASNSSIYGLPSGFHDPLFFQSSEIATMSSQWESNLNIVDPGPYTCTNSNAVGSACTLAIKAVPPTALMLCKGGLGGAANTGTGGDTPVGSGGVRIPPTRTAGGGSNGNASLGWAESWGGSCLFGLGPHRFGNTAINGIDATGPGAGGSGGGNGVTSGTARPGGNGAAGMILAIGFGQ